MVHISNRMQEAMFSTGKLIQFLTEGPYKERVNNPEVCNFVFGNPQEMPVPGFTAALNKWLIPQNKNWFAYKDSIPFAQQVVAESLENRLGISFSKNDVTMTTGAFAAISLSVAALVDPGDEVIFNIAPWFFYEAIIRTWQGIPVKVPVNPQSYDLDLNGIEKSITDRTRMVIINSPHNPTGKIYSRSTLKALSALLSEASKRIGHTIYILSDEAYCKIIFEDQDCPSVAQFYPNTLVVYTYAKTLLIPGQRLGYIALPSQMPHREILFRSFYMAAACAGYTFPNAVMQYAIKDLEGLSIDMVALKRRRDKMIGALKDIGYHPNCPEGTFYIMVPSPISDDIAFVSRLAEHNVLVLPGSVLEMPGFFRISLTASDAMVERSLVGFRAVYESYSEHNEKACQAAI